MQIDTFSHNNTTISEYLNATTDFDNVNVDDSNFNHLLDRSQCTLCIVLEWYIEKLHTYYVPGLIAVGLIGNSISFLVFVTTHLKVHSSSYYLAALAAVEFLFVLTLLFVLLDFNNVLTLYSQNVFCQLFVYTSSVCSTLSSWLIVAFTVERFIAVQYPLQRPHICTVSRARRIVGLLVTVAMLSQSYVFWTASVIAVGEGVEICEMRDEYRDLMKVINFFDTALTLVGPTLLIVVMNVMIGRNVYLFRVRVRHSSAESRGVDPGRGVFLETSISKSVSDKRTGSQQSYDSNSSRKLDSDSEKCSRIRMHSASKNSLNTRSQRNITKVLLLVSTVFILLNFPSYVIRLLSFFVYNVWGKEPPELLWWLQQLSMLLFYTNYSINFLLYAMCGATFRRCLRQLIPTKLQLYKSALK